MSATAQFASLVLGSSSQLHIQNFWPQTYLLNGVLYSFVPFVYQGAGQELGADNGEAFIAVTNTSMSLAILNRNVINKPITIRSRWLADDLTTINTAYSKDETYLINAIAWNEERVEVRLRSPVDAATATFPNRRITTQLVGDLPRENSLRIA